MGCCGQNRMRVSGITTKIVSVRYMGNKPIAVRGRATGKGYRFSERQRTQNMDPGDAKAVLRSPYFRAARGVQANAQRRRNVQSRSSMVE